MAWKRKARHLGSPTLDQPAPERSSQIALREFAYLDEVSVQSLLVSIVGTLPAEVTSLTAQSRDAELGGVIGVSSPLVGKAELSSRYKEASSSSRQVLGRAVAESLFKYLYEEISARLVWSPNHQVGADPIQLRRGDLIEIEVELAPDPIYAFNATMGVLTDIAEDYPAMANDESAAMIMAESGPIIRVLQRLLAGLIPIKGEAVGLRAGTFDGKRIAAPAEWFEGHGLPSETLRVVGVTEEEKYWRDVRRVLFSQSRFTILGRLGRSGVQANWVPVKVAEVMREIAPQFPDAITRAGRIEYSAPATSPIEENRDAFEKALIVFARLIAGETIDGHAAEIAEVTRAQRENADSLLTQGQSFDLIAEWLVSNDLIETRPENERELRAQARQATGLRGTAKPLKLADFTSKESTDEPPEESLLDLEVIAIYW
jgi:hypothetical protein